MLSSVCVLMFADFNVFLLSFSLSLSHTHLFPPVYSFSSINLTFVYSFRFPTFKQIFYFKNYFCYSLSRSSLSLSLTHTHLLTPTHYASISLFPCLFCFVCYLSPSFSLFVVFCVSFSLFLFFPLSKQIRTHIWILQRFSCLSSSRDTQHLHRILNL